MKVAVCIFGRINKCQNFLANLPIGNEYDVYLSSDCPDKKDVDRFVSLYKPEDYVVSKIDYTATNLKEYDRKLTNIDNMIRHFVNKWRVFTLVKGEYDLVMSLRCDLVYSTPFSFDEIKPNTVYVPLGEDHYGGLNDQAAYGDKVSMFKYMNIVNNMEILLHHGVILHPEIMTRANLVGQGVNIERFPLQYFIQR